MEEPIYRMEFVVKGEKEGEPDRFYEVVRKDGGPVVRKWPASQQCPVSGCDGLLQVFCDLAQHSSNHILRIFECDKCRERVEFVDYETWFREYKPC